ncbi:uncharacterized protein A1O9_10326 [Exophiala aquamarina CBS 119918]|uniref:DUF4604 domain-containing protein n=1 Tax=Exophiala aquamarina CBS 119918 TaxID=1182545 RepID=A0A072P0K0_9EURO|nr:uncharacterized protein A1O9_10326 [Exophiala aquamarina CBS 119918]KEF53351.1 hypothetical protein A1O9_10326 [Exophiala aquamarina CBS 119918]
MAFNAKNLQYNKQEPAFLRRLKGEYVGQDGRQNYQAPRPKRDRLKAGDEDDDPVIVDEQGETVGKEAFERRMRGDDAGEVSKDGDGETRPSEGGGEGGTGDDGSKVMAMSNNERQKVTEIGGAAALKKRKVGKIVGGDEDLENGAGDISRSASGMKEGHDEIAVPKSNEPTVAKKKKGKKIKLSFDEPDG